MCNHFSLVQGLLSHDKGASDLAQNLVSWLLEHMDAFEQEIKKCIIVLGKNSMFCASDTL